MAGRIEAPPAGAPPPTAPGMPPGMPPAPGAARPPAPAAAPRSPMPGEAPPPVRPTINVSARYREIGTIRLFALIFMVIAASTSILDILVSSSGITTISGAGIGLTVGAILCGFIAIINQRNRRLNNITTLLAVGLMIAGVAARPAILTLGQFSISNNGFWLAFVFALFFLLFVEYTHAVRRFWEIGEMAIEKNLKEFDFGHVLRQYMVMGFVWLVVAIIVTFGIVGFQVIMQVYMPSQLGQSAEMMSVYGLAIAEGIVFVILALILSFVLGRKDYAQSFRAATSARAPPKPEGPISAQVVQLGVTPRSTGLSATAPPPRAQ